MFTIDSQSAKKSALRYEMPFTGLRQHKLWINSLKCARFSKASVG